MNRNHNSLSRISLAGNLLIALSMFFSTGFISSSQMVSPIGKNSQPGTPALAQEEQPTLEPAEAIPTETPTEKPVDIPTSEPTQEPTLDPTLEPTLTTHSHRGNSPNANPRAAN